MSLPDLKDYSLSEIEKACQFSKALQRYLRILDSKRSTEKNSHLHLLRHQYWSQCALATILNRKSTPEVCNFWSQSTTQILKRYEQEFLKTGVAAFALGKLGGEELNLSSDIDLFFISAESPNAEQLRLVRRFINELSENGELGFCYRVDIEIRPGGPSAPLISSVKQFQDFYWNSGEHWHRLAFVRLKFLFGDHLVGEEVCKQAKAFAFRKYLDYSVLDSLKELRQKIQRTQACTGETTINLKFVPGGIRDIELFVHSLQTIHGGKIPDLITADISEAFRRLATRELFSSTALKTLSSTYWMLRTLENLIQCCNDQQTYELKLTEMGSFPFENFSDVEVLDSLQKSDQIVSDLLGKIDSSEQSQVNRSQLDELNLLELGFSEDSAHRVWPELLKMTSQSSRKKRDEEIRIQFLNEFIQQSLTISVDKDLMLAQLKEFVRSTRAKSSFFSMILSDKNLFADLLTLFGSSPYLGGIIASRPELLDSFILKTQELDLDNTEILLEQLYDRRLLGEIIASSQFIKSQDIEEMTMNLSNNADTICKSLLENLYREFSCENLNMLALGKWGGRELGLNSDIDFAFICKDTPGPTELKMARRFLSRISGQVRGGSIFNVDLRLRPSGQVGPLIVTEAQLAEFVDGHPEAWVRQSYLRMRPLQPMQFHPLPRLLSYGLNPEELKELKSIREKLIKPFKKDGDLKLAPGGLIDTELSVQTLVLKNKYLSGTSTMAMLDQLKANNCINAENESLLRQNYIQLRTYSQLLSIFSGHSGHVVKPQSRGFGRVAAYLNTDPFKLFEEIQTLLKSNRSLLEKVDPIYCL